MAKTGDSGYAPHTLSMSADELCDGLDPLLLDRKGHIIFLAKEDADISALSWVCRDYYGSRSFDAIPTMVHSLSQAYRDHPGLEDSLFLLAVQRGIDIFIVGNAQAVVRLIRYSIVRDLFDAAAARTGFRIAMTEHPQLPQAPRLYSTQWRLVKDDALLLTVRAAGEHITAGALNRAVRPGRSSRGAARGLSRHRHVPRDAPLIVVRHTPISPVPEMLAPAHQEPEPKPDPRPRERRQGVSPVFMAGLITLVAVLFAVWRTGARVDPAELPGYLEMMFFPQATPTPSPTLLSGEVVDTDEFVVYEAPELFSPYDGARVSSADVVLLWDWGQDLAEDERFEIIVQPPGNEPEARTLTRERQLSVTQGPEGWYTWTVRIVNTETGSVPVAFSPRAEQSVFHWSVD